MVHMAVVHEFSVSFSFLIPGYNMLLLLFTVSIQFSIWQL